MAAEAEAGRAARAKVSKGNRIMIYLDP